MDFSKYEIDPAIYDEMFQSDGAPRAHSERIHEALNDLSSAGLGEIQERVTRSFLNGGITFTVYGDDEADERIIPIDCLPRTLPDAEWRQIEAGLAQRVRTLNLFLTDVYGGGRVIADGVIPEEMVHDCPQYRAEMRGFSPPHGTWVAVCGTDVVRTNDGFLVLEDNLRVPSGVSYMIANRKAVKSSMRRLYRRCRVREVEHYGNLLLATLREIAPPDRPDPCIALLTPGVWNSAFYEHVFLARELGAELVEGRDLLARDGFIYIRTTEGLRQVDVIYRRVDDDFLDPLAFRPDSLLGVPGLLQAYRLGNVSLANAPGTGVADDKSVYSYVPDLIRYYLHEEPILASVPTHVWRRPAELEYTLDNLEDLIVKRVGGSGGYGMLVGPHATPAEREAYAREMRANPADFISQPVLQLSRAPCLVDGQPEPRHVDLRPFVLTGRETRIVPGAFCRVALRRSSIVVNSSQGAAARTCGSCRTDMLARTAESLYWMGRYIERTEHICRLLRVQMEVLVDRPVGEINLGWRRIYVAVGRQPPSPAVGFAGADDDFALADSFTLADDLTFERMNPDSVRNCFSNGRENARQTRHCISGEMWTCLNLAWLRLRERRIQDIWKTAPESFYTEVAQDMGTFLGVMDATMYRDDGWRFLQLGRAIERAQSTIGLLLAQFEAVRSPDDAADEEWSGLLRICGASDAYRRCFGIELRPERVLDLLVDDPLLSRSLSRSLEAAAARLSSGARGPSPLAAARELVATARRPWPAAASLDQREDRLRRMQARCRALHDLVMTAHVWYDVDGALPSRCHDRDADRQPSPARGPQLRETMGGTTRCVSFQPASSNSS